MNSEKNIILIKNFHNYLLLYITIIQQLNKYSTVFIIQ